VKGGRAETAYPVAHPTTSNATDDLGQVTYDAKTGLATVPVAALDGSVRFTAERKGPSGWVSAGHYVGKIEKGKASAQIGPKPPEGAKLTNPSWSGKDLTHGDDVTVTVDAQGAKDGTPVYFAVERNDGGTWVNCGTGKGSVKGGKGSATVTVEHPASSQESATAADLAKRKLRFRSSFVPFVEMRVSAEIMPDLTARKVRFRAEVLPDTEARALRFKAEPVPDLRPRKVRFRAELPVPEGPLSRLTVKLVGGTDDDTVSTAASSAGN
jgi:hypothetical protein